MGARAPGGFTAVLALATVGWSGLAGSAGAAVFTLPGNAGASAGASTTVSILVDDASGMLGTDIVVTFDPNVAVATTVSRTTISSAQSLTVNLGTPGLIRVSLYGTAPLAGIGALLDVGFTSSGPPGSRTPLTFTYVDLNEGGIPGTVNHGSYCVQGRAAPAQHLTMALPPGSTVATASWDTHPYSTGYNLYRGAQRDLSDLACFLAGVTATSAQDDGAVPPVGTAFYYLVTAVTCAGESSPGFSSAGVERTIPAACP